VGVLVTKRDVVEQFRRYERAQAAALKASGEFERACNTYRPSEECQEAWARVGDAEAALESEWRQYQKIAPARMRAKGNR
jgi:predicted secreted Zn-dependent protease